MIETRGLWEKNIFWFARSLLTVKRLRVGRHFERVLVHINRGAWLQRLLYTLSEKMSYCSLLDVFANLGMINRFCHMVCLSVELSGRQRGRNAHLHWTIFFLFAPLFTIFGTNPRSFFKHKLLPCNKGKSRFKKPQFVILDLRNIYAVSLIRACLI